MGANSTLEHITKSAMKYDAFVVSYYVQFNEQNTLYIIIVFVMLSCFKWLCYSEYVKILWTNADANNSIVPLKNN